MSSSAPTFGQVGSPEPSVGADVPATQIGRADLYREHRRSVERVCRRYLRDPALVDDAVQEAFARGLAKLHTCRAESGFGPWFRAIARNVCLDVLRERSREHDLGERELRGLATESPEHDVVARGRREAVRDTLALLTARDAEMLVAHHVDGASLRDIARTWGLTVNSARIALQRARERFRERCDTSRLAVLPLADGMRRLGHWVATFRSLQVRDLASAWTWLVAPAVAALVVLPAVGEKGPADAGAVHERVPGRELPVASIGTSSRENREGADGGIRPGPPARPAAPPVRPSSARRAAASSPDATPVVRHGDIRTADGTTVTQRRPDGERSYAYGAEASIAGQPASVGFETYEDAPAQEVDAVACDAARATPATWCETSHDG